MKAAIVYFSGTGNTFRVGELFKDYLEGINYQVDMIDISKHDKNLKDYDLFIVGTPSYTKTSSFNMYDFIENHITKTNNPSANFITYVTYGWDTAFGHLTLKDFVTKKGFKVLGARPFLAPSNFYMYNGEKHPKQSEKEIRQLYQTIYNDVKDLMDAYVSGRIQIDKRSAFKKNLFMMVSKFGQDKFITKFPEVAITVDNDKCVQCKVCVKKCPNNNIALQDGQITFSDHCSACSRCMHICPKNAYQYKGDTFEQYKIKQEPIIEQL